MLRRSRLRRRILGPFCRYWGWGWHHPFGPYGPPPHPWWEEELSPEEEKDDLKDYLKMLKEELGAVEDRIKELEKAE